MDVVPGRIQTWRRMASSRAGRHLVDGAAPVTAFLAGYNAAGPAAGIAVAFAAAGVLATVRLRQGESLRMVLISVAMVGVHSLLVVAGGKGRDFFTTEMVGHTLFTAVFAASVLLGKPFTGMVARRIGLEVPAWRFDPPRLRKHRRMTGMLFAVWLLQLVPMVPLYVDDHATALGVVTTFVVKPTAVAAVVLCWRWMRRPIASGPAESGQVASGLSPAEPRALPAGSSRTPAGS